MVRPVPSFVRSPRGGTLLVALVVATAVAGCTPERGETDGDEATVASTLAVPQVTAPPERQTPFCQIMLQLDASLPEDQTLDVTDLALDAYREALPVAPPEIAAELEAVIVGLETGTDPTLSSADTRDEVIAEPSVDAEAVAEPATGDTFVPSTAAAAPSSSLEPPPPEEAFTAEGYLPDDDPTVRLNEYVDFACRDNLNNPGPPATQPSATPAPTTDE